MNYHELLKDDLMYLNWFAGYFVNHRTRVLFGQSFLSNKVFPGEFNQVFA